jgi:hypothetical protein
VRSLKCKQESKDRDRIGGGQRNCRKHYRAANPPYSYLSSRPVPSSASRCPTSSPGTSRKRCRSATRRSSLNLEVQAWSRESRANKRRLRLSCTGRRACACLVGLQCAACEGDGRRSPCGGRRRSWNRLSPDVELQAHRQRRHARYHRGNVPRRRLRAADDLHARRAHGGLAMANDPIVDEIHAIREEIARRHDYNLDAIVETFQKTSAKSGRHVVTLPPRPVVKPERARKAS